MPKFIREEKEFLAELVRQHPHVTSTGYSTEVLIKKKTSWDEIRQAFNAQFPGKPPRDLPQLQGLWKRIRMVAKEKNDERRCEAKRTGGGPPSTPPTVLDNLVIEIIGDSQDPTNFAMDDDGVIEISDKLEDNNPTASSHTTPHADQRTKKRSRADMERSELYTMAQNEHLEKMKLFRERHCLDLRQMEERHKVEMEILELKRELVLKQINQLSDK